MTDTDALKKAWTEVVVAEDLDAHMEATEQGPTNAKIAKEMLTDEPLDDDAKILIPGCGTGQIFDYLPPEILKKYKFLCTDINTSFLRSLENRVKNNPQMRCGTAIDNIEETELKGPFNGILAILLLEHTDIEKTIGSITKLEPQKIYIIIQENKESKEPVVNTQRQLRESIRKFAQIAKSHLVDKKALVQSLASKGFTLVNTNSKNVPDNKTMSGLVFEKVKN